MYWETRLPLFFGKDSFSGFTDQYGNAVEKNQIQKWIKDYRNLELTITDEKGKIRIAKISGIIKEPGELVCMDRGQLEEIEKKTLQITGGYMEIWGYHNAEEAKEILVDDCETQKSEFAFVKYIQLFDSIRNVGREKLYIFTISIPQTNRFAIA